MRNDLEPGLATARRDARANRVRRLPPLRADSPRRKEDRRQQRMRFAISATHLGAACPHAIDAHLCLRTHSVRATMPVPMLTHANQGSVRTTMPPHSTDRKIEIDDGAIPIGVE